MTRIDKRSIEAKYGVRVPLSELWQHVKETYGDEMLASLKSVYSTAQARYARASQLNQFRRQITHEEIIYDHNGKIEQLKQRHKYKYRKYCLEHHEDFLTGKIPPMTAWKE